MQDLGPKLGGFLYVFAIGLMMTPIALILDIMWAVTSSGLTEDVMFWAVVVDVISILLVIYVASRFFRKKRNTPMAFMTLFVYGIIESIVWCVVHSGTTLEPEFQEAVIAAILRGILCGAYFLNSERVKATFVVP